LLLLRVDGAYTEEARRNRIGGPVTIRLVGGTDGRPHNARVVKGLGSGLDENALRASSLWRFEPGRQGGLVVACQATMQMNFRIL
jgi:protein TonB